MTRTIEQTIEFHGVSPTELFETYLDSKKHAAAIGASASIDRHVGGKFSAFGEGHLIGTVLHIVPDQMVVQTWKAQTHWKDSDLDSVLVLTFEAIPGGAKIGLVHSGVPDDGFVMFSEGWRERYWKPWTRHFEEQAKTR